MSTIQKRQTDRVAKGSLSDVAKSSNVSLAEAFLDVDAIVIVDTSGSMGARDTRDGRSRYETACDELAKLQADLPGRIAVIAFSDHPEFCPSGYPRYIGASTAMEKALSFVHVADGCDIKFFLISDGYPDDEQATLRVASTFTSKVSTIFIGHEGDPGADFLRCLAAATGGVSVTRAAEAMSELGSTVRLLLNA